LKLQIEYAIIADLHCHTIASTHAYSTITELAQAASRRGLTAVGCTDHGTAMWDAPKSSYFGNLNDLPDIIEGVRVLKGVEANIMDFDGHLDMNDDILGRLELVVASMHGGIMPTGTVDECTAAWLAVAENPNVDIIGHSGSPEYAYDYETVIQAFAKNGKAVELMLFVKPQFLIVGALQSYVKNIMHLFQSIRIHIIMSGLVFFRIVLKCCEKLTFLLSLLLIRVLRI